MAHTGTAVGGFGKKARADYSLILALPSDLLVILAEMLGNPLALLCSKAHLSKAFHAAACDALAILKHVDLNKTSH